MLYRNRCRATAKKILISEQGEDVDEGMPTLKYYTFVRMGKKKYAGTTTTARARVLRTSRAGADRTLQEPFRTYPRSRSSCITCTARSPQSQCLYRGNSDRRSSARRRAWARSARRERRRRVCLAAASVRPMLQRARATKRTYRFRLERRVQAPRKRGPFPNDDRGVGPLGA